MSEQEQADVQAKAQKAASDLAKWQPKLEKLRSAVQSASKSQRAQRRSKLEAIHDPAAVGAIDAVFCARGGEDTQLGISLLENLQSAESATILARYAVFAPWDTAGKCAAQALRSQRKQDYVPLLLPGLQSPVYSRARRFISARLRAPVTIGRYSSATAKCARWPLSMPILSVCLRLTSRPVSQRFRLSRRRVHVQKA